MGQRIILTRAERKASVAMTPADKSDKPVQDAEWRTEFKEASRIGFQDRGPDRRFRSSGFCVDR